MRRKVHLSENVEEKLDINVIWNLLNKLPGGVFMQAAQNKRLASQDNNNIYSHDSGIIKRNNCSITYILFNAKHGNYLFFKTQFLSLVKKNTMLSFLKIQIYVLKWTVILLAPLFLRCAFKLVEVLLKVPFP